MLKELKLSLVDLLLAQKRAEDAFAKELGGPNDRSSQRLSRTDKPGQEEIGQALSMLDDAIGELEEAINFAILENDLS